jgi:uncharacterized protein (UPF0332 family)
MNFDRAYKFDWANYLKLAEEILKLDPNHDTAYVRSSLSRAYYSVFCIARNMRRFDSYEPPEDAEERKSIHKIVLDAYKDSPNDFDHDIFEHLDWLKKWRNQADYREYRFIRRKLAEDAIERAKECMEILLREYGDNY